ncbi:MAG: thioredoxin domain-containing protein [Candidatus Micrarchaeia archaeon]
MKDGRVLFLFMAIAVLGGMLLLAGCTGGETKTPAQVASEAYWANEAMPLQITGMEVSNNQLSLIVRNANALPLAITAMQVGGLAHVSPSLPIRMEAGTSMMVTIADGRLPCSSDGTFTVAAAQIRFNYTNSNGVSFAQNGVKPLVGKCTGGVAPYSNGTVVQPPAGDWSFVDSDPSIGPKDAKVTVVEFADYQCPYCGIVNGRNLGGAQYDSIRGTAPKIEEEYAKAGKIRFVYHPMAFLGQESVDAANAAMCARAIGGDEAYFKMHDLLFSKQQGENDGTFSIAKLKQYAAEAGFNSTEMTGCIENGTYAAALAQKNNEAAGAGVTGTPAFAVNGQVVDNGAVYSILKAKIDSYLQ